MCRSSFCQANKEPVFGSPHLYESKLRSLNNKQVKEFTAFPSSTIAQKQLKGTDAARYPWDLHGISTEPAHYSLYPCSQR